MPFLRWEFATAIVLLFVGTFASAAEPLVSLGYSHGLRISNHRVRISIDRAGLLTVAATSKGKEVDTRKVELSADKLRELNRKLDRLNWRRIAADEVMGLDGSSVRIRFREHSVSLWSPDYRTKKRGLNGFRKVVEGNFALAGLDETGMANGDRMSAPD